MKSSGLKAMGDPEDDEDDEEEKKKSEDDEDEDDDDEEEDEETWRVIGSFAAMVPAVVTPPDP